MKTFGLTIGKASALPLLIALGVQASFAVAEEDDSMYGTHSVVFQPIRFSGVLEGCTLIYRAVQADTAYLNGNPVGIVGNIGVNAVAQNMVLTFKIGVKDLLADDAPYVPPNFAYLLVGDKSTASSEFKSRVSDDGFRFIVYSFDELSSNVLFGMLDSSSVTIGFNRREGGMDVLVPIDLTVFDAVPIPPDKFLRKRSPDSVMQFLACFKDILESSLPKPQQ